MATSRQALSRREAPPRRVLKLRILIIAILMLAWQAAAMSGLFYQDVVLGLPDIALGLAQLLLDPEFYRNLWVTLAEVLAAAVIGALAGLAGGMALGGSRILERAFERYLYYLGPTPKIIFFPLMILWFGVGPGSKVALGALSCFFPVALAVAAGMREIPFILKCVGISLRATPLQKALKIYLPAMRGPAINGLRMGFGVAVIGAEATGAADFWYVRSDSPLHSVKDATPQTTIAYSTNGSSTNSVVLGFAKAYGLKSKLVATGSPSATFTQVMTKQVDVGWSAPPFGFDALAQDKIRIVAKANDLDEIRHESIRTLVANVNVLEHKQDPLKRFMAAYRETIDWMYASDDALKAYATFNKTDMATARKVRDEFFPKSLIDPDRMIGLDLLNKDGMAFKAISAPLTQQQLATLIQIPPRQ